MREGTDVDAEALAELDAPADAEVAEPWTAERLRSTLEAYLAEARAFYGELFGWTFSSWHDGEYWLIEAAPGESIGGLMARNA